LNIHIPIGTAVRGRNSKLIGRNSRLIEAFDPVKCIIYTFCIQGLPESTSQNESCKSAFFERL
jgi:hypothetical protein